MLKVILALPLTLSALYSGWGQRISYPELNSVTRIEIRAGGNVLIKEITSTDQIARIVSFVNQRRTGWKTGWFGVPIPRVVVNLYDGAEFSGHFGVGRGFFETQRGDGFNSKTEEIEDGFHSKSATRKEVDDFIALIGVPQDLVYGEPRLIDKKGDDSPVGVPATRDWTSSGRLVKRGDRIHLTATGVVQLNSSGLTSGPQGVDTEDAEKLMLDRPTGALIAAIGADGVDFIFIGSTAEFVAHRYGLLFLGVNDGDFSDNSGSYTVTIEIKEAKEAK